MPQSKPNQFARVFAVFALLGAFILVVATIATSGGGSDDDGGDEVEGSGPTKRGQRALNKGVWVVGKGDTLVSISEETGIELDELIQLNAAIDPQSLNTGQRISLRRGATADGGGSGQEDAGGGGPPGTETGTGVGDGGPSGAGSEDTDGITSN